MRGYMLLFVVAKLQKDTPLTGISGVYYKIVLNWMFFAGVGGGSGLYRGCFSR
jgi:hypothetical protein